jgi:putative SOS response-associated peptidase YedK
MCGRLNVSDDPLVQSLLKELGVVSISNMIYAPFIGAASPVSVVREIEGRRQTNTATWWLLLEHTAQGFKPNSKYATFNTRYDKLNQNRTAGFVPYRQSRCIIPASGFGETMNRQYHDMTAQNSAIAFAGLYKQYLHQKTGESAIGCSIITVPPHPKFDTIHKKASPMMLKPDEFDLWLDPSYQDTQEFDRLLVPRLHCDFIAQKIDKPSVRNPIDAPFLIAKDA